MKFTSLVVATLASIAQAVDVHVVAVGKNPGRNQTALKFFPEKIAAQPGSMVQFQFYAGNHTVTQSNFDNPCVPISTINASAVGVYSSFMPVSAAARTLPVFTVMINDTKPVWIYCSQGPHCQKGMSMVINENTAANASRSLEAYKKLAETSATGAGEIPGGGSRGGTGTSGSGSTPGESSPKTSGTLTAGSVNLAVPSTLLLILGAGFMAL